MQPVRRRTKRNKSNPDLVKEKVALERVLGAPVVALEARLPQELKESSRGAGRTAVEQLREQLDTLSIGTRRPCPLDASKCSHQLQVDQDTLYFPFEPLAPQRAVCNHVIKACDRGGIALLQSPTGTGKSLALLCAALAWQRRVASMASSMEGSTGTGTVPQIVYGVRTHTQIKQIIVELKKSGYRPRMAVIGSREQLCANSAVQRHAKQQQVPLNFSCRQAARCAAAQLPGGCQLYTGMGNTRYAKRIFDRCGQAGRLWDVEDLIASSTAQDSVAGCPYYTAHILAGDADIVFCPHNYILDPSVSQCRSHHRERWSLKGRVVIIDEAHNLEQCCREAGSLELSISDLRLMSRNLRQMPLRHPKLRFSERRSCAEVAAELERLPLQLSAFLSSQRIPPDTTRETSGTPALASHVLWGLPKVQTTKVFLQQCGLTAAGLLSKSMEDLSIEAIDKLLQAQLSSEQQRTAESEDAELLTVLEKLRDLIFKLRLTCKHSDSYVVAIHPGNEARLCLWLMSPGVLFEVFAHAAHAVLLASGTLSPGALQTELMESSDAMLSRSLLEGPLEVRHTVNPWQLFAAVLPCAGWKTAAVPVVSTYGNWQSEEFVQNLGLSVLEVIRCVPAGVLCFLPSYQSLDLAVLFWRRSGLYRKLEEVKTLVVEPRSSCEMSDASQRFMAGVKDGRGALCLAVYRGKMSEGLDFTDDLCRAVICIGVPYPQMNDPVVVAKRQWNDAKRSQVHNSNGRLSGDQWYELQAHRAVNQALGRLLRHGGDYGALLLLDARWARRGAKARNLREKLSTWIQNHLVDWPCTSTGLENFSQRLRQHFEYARQLPLQPRSPPVMVPTPLRCEATPTPPALPAKRPFLELLTARSCPKMA